MKGTTTSVMLPLLLFTETYLLYGGHKYIQIFYKPLRFSLTRIMNSPYYIQNHMPGLLVYLILFPNCSMLDSVQYLLCNTVKL